MKKTYPEVLKWGYFSWLVHQFNYTILQLSSSYYILLISASVVWLWPVLKNIPAFACSSSTSCLGLQEKNVSVHFLNKNFPVWLLWAVKMLPASSEPLNWWTPPKGPAVNNLAQFKGCAFRCGINPSYTFSLHFPVAFNFSDQSCLFQLLLSHPKCNSLNFVISASSECLVVVSIVVFQATHGIYKALL